MIDIESELYTDLAQVLRAKWPQISVAGEYLLTPARFPHVSIVEVGNHESARHRDNSGAERLAVLTYQIDVYSNKGSGKKSECKAILAEADEMMRARNFRRESRVIAMNEENATVYRLTARYRGATDGVHFYKI